MPEPRVHSINVNPAGGVPKLPIERTMLRRDAVEGDKQRNLKLHGGPMRAVCLYSLERIEALRGEGHPISPGSVGENLTLAGIDWDRVAPGDRFAIGDAELEVTQYTLPCKQIAGSFHDGRFVRIAQEQRPGWSRVYARVVREGMVRAGDSVTWTPRERSGSPAAC
ncbi:MAG: MOSC domain-containing protein [Tepidisphaeraceae bacterium]